MGPHVTAVFLADHFLRLNLDLTNTVLGIIVSCAAIYGAVTLALRPVRRNTNQLKHNGGSHVADYAKDARDDSKLNRESLGRIEARLLEQDKDIREIRHASTKAAAAAAEAASRALNAEHSARKASKAAEDAVAALELIDSDTVRKVQDQ